MVRNLAYRLRARRRGEIMSAGWGVAMVEAARPLIDPRTIELDSLIDWSDRSDERDIHHIAPPVIALPLPEPRPVSVSHRRGKAAPNVPPLVETVERESRRCFICGRMRCGHREKAVREALNPWPEIRRFRRKVTFAPGWEQRRAEYLRECGRID